MLKKCDGRTNGRTDEQTDLCIELRYAQLKRYKTPLNLFIFIQGCSASTHCVSSIGKSGRNVYPNPCSGLDVDCIEARTDIHHLMTLPLV